jgi:hypothetical protein
MPARGVAYLDTSVLVAMFTHDPLSARADRLFLEETPRPIVSDYAAAEFSSAIARLVRTKDLIAGEARAAFEVFDQWCTRTAHRVELRSADVAEANRLIRKLRYNLRAPDAIHLSVAQRLEVPIATFDAGLAAVANAVGVGAVPN